MNVLLINQYFWPDRAATAQLLADLAEDLARDGWTVTALAGRGTYAPGRPGPLPARERFGDVQVRRVRCTDFGRLSRFGKLGRIADYATFLLAAALAVLCGPRPDVVVCLSTPPFVALLGALGRLRGARFVYKVEDLYPDVAIALGAFAATSWAARFARRLSASLLARADAVVALDSAMAAALRERGARRVEVIPNWADGAAIRPDPAAGARFRTAEGLGERLVVTYSGNLGLAHRFDAVAGAAHLLHDSLPRLLWLIVGDGPRLEELKRQVEGLPSVRFLGYQPRERLGEMYSAADLHLITLRDEVAGLLVPSKYAAALAAGRPVLVVGGAGTDLHTEVAEQRLGWVCPHEPAAVATAVSEAERDPEALRAMGQAARALFDRKYSRTAATA
ncbi:MAG TPA: glycosyltransferase family 4 protein, partial [Thermoanaerobaculia bacterium]